MSDPAPSRAGAPRIDATTLVLLVLPPLFWAGNAVVGRLAVGTIAPLALNATRWLLAGLVLLPFVWRPLLAHAPVLKRQWKSIALLGVCGIGCYNTLQYAALTTSTANNVTLIAASTPVFTMLLGASFFHERLDGRRLVGAAVSIVGVLVVLLHGDVGRLATLSFVPGDLLMLAAAAIWSLYTWLLRATRPALPGPVLLFSQIVFGSAFAVPCALIESLVFGVPSHFDLPRAWALLAYVAVLPSVVAYLLWDRGVARAGATLPVFFTNLTPLFAALISAVLLGERPHVYHAVAMGLILVGIRLATGRR